MPLHVKIQMGLLIKIFQFETVIFWGVGVGKLALFLGYVKASSTPFQEERLDLGLYGGCNVTIQMGMLIQFFGFEI